jgi:hypothetical protein
MNLTLIFLLPLPVFLIGLMLLLLGDGLERTCQIARE